jgi:hypothetical protein
MVGAALVGIGGASVIAAAGDALCVGDPAGKLHPESDKTNAQDRIKIVKNGFVSMPEPPLLKMNFRLMQFSQSI